MSRSSNPTVHISAKFQTQNVSNRADSFSQNDAEEMPFDLLVLDMEVDIESVEQLCVEIAQQVLRHSNVLVAAVVRVSGGCLRCLIRSVVFLQCCLANLDPGRVERRVLILDGADEHDILEPF